MITTQKKGVSFYRFPHFQPFSGITHGIFSRRGGFSLPPYDSLNACFGIGDKDQYVIKNRDLIAQCMDTHGMLAVKQVHSDQVVVVKKNGIDEERENNPTLGEGDAIVTDLSGKVLVITVADCQAVLLYDPDKHVIANVHSGWRGSIMNIVGRTIETMTRKFNCHPKSIMAGVGPSLGPCCAEFVNYQAEIPSQFWKYKNAVDHFDFWAISYDQLRKADVPAKNIFSAGWCTRCKSATFFSYRAERTTGRFAAVIGLR